MGYQKWSEILVLALLNFAVWFSVQVAYTSVGSPSFKVKCTLVQALKLCTGRTALRESRGIALLFHDHGTRGGWGVSVTSRPLFTPGKDPVPIVQEAGWAPGPVWTGAENLAPSGIRSPDRPARSQALYRLSYPKSIMLRYEFKRKWLLSFLTRLCFVKATTERFHNRAPQYRRQSYRIESLHPRRHRMAPALLSSAIKNTICIERAMLRKEQNVNRQVIRKDVSRTLQLLDPAYD